MSEFETDILATVLHAARYRSRRQAKRLLHEAGMTHASAADLDQVLGMIREHPEREAIEAQAEALQAAGMEGQRRRAGTGRQGAGPGDPPRWLIGETPEWGRTWIVHFCPGGAWSFCGQVVDEPTDPRLEHYPLDEGQVLTRITWLDGERPPEAERLHLMAEARREMRIYDQGTSSRP